MPAKRSARRSSKRTDASAHCGPLLADAVAAAMAQSLRKVELRLTSSTTFGGDHRISSARLHAAAPERRTGIAARPGQWWTRCHPDGCFVRQPSFS